MVRLPLHELAPGERDLEPEDAKYLLKVHRLGVGDGFIAFDGQKRVEADGVVEGARRVRIGALRPARTAGRDITWIHAFPKGDKADAIVRDTTELGASRIVFCPAERSVARPKAERKKRWERIAEQAARQCGRGDVPSVAMAPSWPLALEGAKGTSVCLVPHGKPLREVLSGATGALSFAAGPEGGLTREEVEAAMKQGFIACSLGGLVMRTETVPAAVLGAVALLL